MAAFCPHLGANLSFGRVVGDCIECPFHGWRFTGEGRVRSIPYSDRIPRGVRAETFPVQEDYGQIFMFHRDGGPQPAAGDPPPYDVPRIPEVDDGRFVFRGRHDAGRVPMNIVEFAENAVDMAHFAPLHGQMRIPWTRIRVPGVSIDHETEWSLDEDRAWVMQFVDHATLRILGRRVERTAAEARVTYTGPGSIVNFRFTIPGKGEIEMIQTHLPVGPLEQQVDFTWFADRRVPRLLVWYVIGNWISQWQRDLEIWANKIFLERPGLCPDDGPVYRLRQWYRQFLPD